MQVCNGVANSVPEIYLGTFTYYLRYLLAINKCIEATCFLRTEYPNKIKNLRESKLGQFRFWEASFSAQLYPSLHFKKICTYSLCQTIPIICKFIKESTSWYIIWKSRVDESAAVRMRGCSLSTGAFLLSRLNRPSVTKSFPAFRGFEMQSSFPRLWKARPSWRRHLVRSKVVSSVNLRFSSYSLGVKETSFYPTMPNLSAVRVLFSFFLPFSLSLSLSLSLSPIKLSPWCNTSSKRFIWNEDHARSDRCRLKWYDLICTSIIPASFDRKETRNSHSASLHSYVILLPRFY